MEKKTNGRVAHLPPCQLNGKNLEIFLDLTWEPPRRKGGNMKWKNPESKFLGRIQIMEPVAEGYTFF